MKKLIYLSMLIAFAFSVTSCDEIKRDHSPTSNSGVKATSVIIKTDENGRSVEQNQIAKRLEIDNMPGSIKHLYIISSYSGQVLIYSTVKGKVTSSGKRLTPLTVASSDAQYTGGISVNVGGYNYRTSEVIQDDGTYGSSVEYLYWFDSKGVYHQQYVTGGMILHISDQPMPIKSVVINMEAR